MTIELDVSVAAWPITYDVVVQPGPVLIDVAVDTRPIIVVVGQLFPDIHVPVDLGDWLDFAPHGVGAGANIKVPFDAAAMAGFAPGVHIGVRIAPPVDALSWEDVAPAVYIGGVRVAVPVNAAEATEFAPTIQTGINLALPFDVADWSDRAPAVGYGINVFVPADALVVAEDYAPLILTGVRLAVPGDAAEWADFSPSLSIVVDVPGDAMVMADFVPAVAGGMSVAVPSDGMTWADYEPSFDWYGFSNGFSNGFNAVPHGEDLAIPADAMSWSDSAPTIEAESEIEASYLGTALASSVSGGTYSVTGFSFGAEAPSRKLLFAVHTGRGDTLSLLSATVGGQTATIIGTAVGNRSGIRHGVWLIGVELPTGTSGDVVLTFNGGSLSSPTIFGYRTVNQISLTPYDLGETSWDGVSSSRSASADVQAGGFFISASTVYHDSGSTSMTGVTLDYTVTVGNIFYFGGDSIEAEAVLNKTTTVSKSGGAENMYGGLIAASFR